MLLVVSAVKLIAEIALMALAGQWLLGLLAGSKRESKRVPTFDFSKQLDSLSPEVRSKLKNPMSRWPEV